MLGLPVPKVICWSAHANNPVESEYIIMEEANGTQLGELWDDMKLREKRRIVKDILGIQKKLLSVSFTLFVIP